MAVENNCLRTMHRGLNMLAEQFPQYQMLSDLKAGWENSSFMMRAEHILPDPFTPYSMDDVNWAGEKIGQGIGIHEALKASHFEGPEKALHMLADSNPNSVQIDQEYWPFTKNYWVNRKLYNDPSEALSAFKQDLPFGTGQLFEWGAVPNHRIIKYKTSVRDTHERLSENRWVRMVQILEGLQRIKGIGTALGVMHLASGGADDVVFNIATDMIFPETHAGALFTVASLVPSASVLKIANTFKAAPSLFRFIRSGASESLFVPVIERFGSQSQKMITAQGIPNAGGVIRSFITTQEEVYYRVYSGDNISGLFLTKVRPKSPVLAQNGLALPPSNTADFIQEVIVPAGVRLQRSRALPVLEWGKRGGMEQFQILDMQAVSKIIFKDGVPF